MSTRHSDPAGWLLLPAEGDVVSPHQARFRRWVSCGERDDYAAVTVEPPFEPSETGLPRALADVILGPRHLGVNLRSLTEFPAHVYVMTASPPLAGGDAPVVSPDALEIRMWALLEGRLAG